MSEEDYDMAESLKPKSNQLNGDNLRAGPIIARVTGCRKVRDQVRPYVFSLSDGHMPWKPCLTMRRLLTDVNGTSKTSAVVGQYIEFYRDPDVTYGKDRCGGIRVSGMSAVKGPPRNVTLRTSQTKCTTYTVRSIRPQSSGAPTANLDKFLEDEGLTVDAVNKWRAANNKAAIAELNDADKAQFAGWLGGQPKRVEEIRALIPAEATS